MISKKMIVSDSQIVQDEQKIEYNIDINKKS